MDDEEVIRRLAGEMLKLGGYQPLTVANGEEAIEAYKQAATTGDRFAAVILDVTIRGGMGGIETATELLKADPDVAIIVSTGYSDEAEILKLRGIAYVGLIPKPYLLHELLGTVKRAIAQRRFKPGTPENKGEQVIPPLASGS